MGILGCVFGEFRGRVLGDSATGDRFVRGASRGDGSLTKSSDDVVMTVIPLSIEFSRGRVKLREFDR